MPLATGSPRMRRVTHGRMDPRRALSRVFDSTVLGVAAAMLSVARLPGYAAALVGWNAGALCLLGLTWTLIATADVDKTRRMAGAEDPGRTVVYGIALVTSAASLVAATILVREAHAL